MKLLLLLCLFVHCALTLGCRNEMKRESDRKNHHVVDDYDIKKATEVAVVHFTREIAKDKSRYIIYIVVEDEIDWAALERALPLYENITYRKGTFNMGFPDVEAIHTTIDGPLPRILTVQRREVDSNRIVLALGWVASPTGGTLVDCIVVKSGEHWNVSEMQRSGLIM